MAEKAGSPNEDGVGFGQFRLFPERQLLLEGDRPVRLGSRALEILATLVGRAGELVTKDEIIATVWPDTYVEEANLRVHIAALRKALGDGIGGNRYLTNVPGRGYRFVAEVTTPGHANPPAPPPAVTTRAGNLPASFGRMVGRDDVVDSVAAYLAKHRFVTIVGPGGIGKTTVALAVAEQVMHDYADDVVFVDLAPLANPDLVPTAVAAALGIALGVNDHVANLVNQLQKRHGLLVLDSCERVVEAAATLTEEITRAAPDVHVLATSREPLRASGEYVQRLPPLAVPPEGQTLTASTAMEYAAVQLFVERASASVDTFELRDADAPVVAELCRRLDGIALAIQLAAGRVDAFGVSDLARLLDDRFRLLVRGRRTALPRHQTLTATLDWSYETLSDSEQAVFRRLAVFPGSFDLQSAIAVVSGADVAAMDVVERIADLVAKSLLAADVTASVVRYRLGETTRAYAAQRLEESGEQALVARHHAEFYRNALAAIEGEWQASPSADFLAVHTARIDCVRAALDWGFSPAGDPAIAAALAVAAVPLWMHLSLVDECQRRMTQAIAAIGPADGTPSPADMKLHVALGLSMMFTRGSVEETVAALTRGIEIAQQLGDTEYSLRGLWGLWVGRLNNGAIPEALKTAQAFVAIAPRSRDPVDPAVGERMVGFSLHFHGEPREARAPIERMLARNPGPTRQAQIYRFQFDQWATARGTLAEILWLLGLPEQAMRAAEEAVADAACLDHAVTQCNTLAKSAAVMLLAGNLDAAKTMIEKLRALAGTHALGFWRAEGGCLEGLWHLRSGDLTTGLAVLRKELYDFPGNTLTVRYIGFLGELANALSLAGEFARAQATIDEALERSARNEEHWCLAELLRIKAEITLRETPGKTSEAEALLQESLAFAVERGALAWELRTTSSLARLRATSPTSIAEARDMLAAVYAKFTEGHSTRDLIDTKAQLAALTAAAG